MERVGMVVAYASLFSVVASDEDSTSCSPLYHMSTWLTLTCWNRVREKAPMFPGGRSRARLCILYGAYGVAVGAVGVGVAVPSGRLRSANELIVTTFCPVSRNVTCTVSPGCTSGNSGLRLNPALNICLCPAISR